MLAWILSEEKLEINAKNALHIEKILDGNNFGFVYILLY